jgi:hypothetical protein
VQITLTQNQGTPIEPPVGPSVGIEVGPGVEPTNAATIQIKSLAAPTPVFARISLAENSAPVSTPAAQPIPRTDVTLHQDSHGRAYYLVSDARSGQEIIEIPPEAVRAVGQGIQEYLREEASRASSHLDTKA